MKHWREIVQCSAFEMTYTKTKFLTRFQQNIHPNKMISKQIDITTYLLQRVLFDCA